MDKRIFFTDLDETLLTSQKTISPETAATLARIQDMGHLIVMASGRSLMSILEAREGLPISDKNLYYASYNGGRITEASTGEDICQECLPIASALEFMDLCRQEGVYAHTYMDEQILSPGEGPELIEYRKTIHMPFVECPDMSLSLTKPPYKCLAISLRKEEVLEPLRLKLEPWARAHGARLVYSSPILLECFSLRSGKDSAVRFMRSYTGIPIDRIMAAGDQANDIDMIRAAGLGLAMCNGTAEAREAADKVTSADNNHDGLVPYLKAFFGL